MTTLGAGRLLTPLTPSLPICPPVIDNIETLPATPPDSSDSGESFKVDSQSVKKALHVVSTERDALSNLERLYATSAAAQSSLCEAVSAILLSQSQHGKVVFVGVGKSGWIAQKLVATFNSIDIVSVFLHPTEALHGDLGVIRQNDVVMMITYSGKTQELLTLLPHIPCYIPLMVMTSHLYPETCPLLTHFRRRGAQNILLSAPVHVLEKDTFGLSAPTTSTTVALALGDSLALTIADKMHAPPNKSTAKVFATNHPGGAIGAVNMSSEHIQVKMLELATKVSDIPAVAIDPSSELKCFEVLLAAVRSPRGWVKLSPDHVIAPRRCQKLAKPDTPVVQFEDDQGRVIIERTDWISVPGDMTVLECRRWIMQMRTEGSGRGKQFLRPGTILGIVDSSSDKSSVVEIEDVVGDDFCGNF